jgi:hypothetical protein
MLVVASPCGASPAGKTKPGRRSAGGCADVMRGAAAGGLVVVALRQVAVELLGPDLGPSGRGCCARSLPALSRGTRSGAARRIPAGTAVSSPTVLKLWSGGGGPGAALLCGCVARMRGSGEDRLG